MSSTSSLTLLPSPLSEDSIETEEKKFPIPHTLTTTRSSRTISIKGWKITSTKLPISSSNECDSIASQIGIPVPEMTFGNNSVHIEGPNGWRCVFNTLEALDTVDKTGSDGLRVSYSEKWNRTRYADSNSMLIAEQRIVTRSRGY